MSKKPIYIHLRVKGAKKIVRTVPMAGSDGAVLIDYDEKYCAVGIEILDYKEVTVNNKAI